MTVLVFAECDGAVLDPATARVVTAARALDGEVHVLVVGSAAGGEQAARIAGVAKVVVAAGGPGPLPAEAAAALIARVAGGSVVVAGASARAKAILPRLAAALGLAMVSEIVGVPAPDTFVRPIYAGSLLETVHCPVRKVVTVRAVSFAPAGGQAPAPVETVAAPPDPGLSHLVGAEVRRTTGRPDLAEARIVVAAGRGVASREGFARVEGLADRLKAGLGASRAAVDAGFAPNECQIGQSGRTIAPEVYLALGISGAIQHVAGIREARFIAAVNTDAEAPIFRIADLGLTGDLFAAIPALEAELKARGVV
jgi:electron transfer flavoprotein alpha subunit